MILEEAKLIAHICSTADNGCSVCTRNLCAALRAAFPQFRWTHSTEEKNIDDVSVETWLKTLSKPNSNRHKITVEKHDIAEAENILEIARSLSDVDMEVLIQDAIDAGILKQCRRCSSWLHSTGLGGELCEHCN